MNRQHSFEGPQATYHETSSAGVNPTEESRPVVAAEHAEQGNEYWLQLLLQSASPIAAETTTATDDSDQIVASGKLTTTWDVNQWQQRCLRMAFAGCPLNGHSETETREWKRRAKNRLGTIVALIDQHVSNQVDAVLHHPRFQALEASWRGIQYLTLQVDRERTAPLQVKLLSLTRRQWSSDLLNSTSFDNSELFRRIYDEEFGMPGGKPYGLLLNDFEIGRNPVDWDVLEKLSEVAAAAFCPTVLAASPALLGLDSWGELPFSQQLSEGFQLAAFDRWNRLRRNADSKYLGLALPRTLMREPYRQADTQGFLYEEDTSDPRGGNYLWGSAGYAFAGVVIRSFADSRWLADIRGVERGIEGGGLVADLAKHEFSTDRSGVATKTSLEVILTDRQEAELTSLGFLPLSHCHGTDFAGFFSAMSLQEPRRYEDPGDTANARLGAMLQYTLCVSRFAHYLKVIARDWIGSQKEARELQRTLDRWIKQYVADGTGLPNHVRAQRPLRKAEVQIQAHPMQPGTFQCSIDLWPHYQVDQLTASVQLKTTIVGDSIHYPS